MSTEINESIEAFVIHEDDLKKDQSTMLSVSLQRQNLTGGTGVFSNFFEELAESNSHPPTNINKPINPFIQTADVPYQNQEISPLPRFYAPCSEDDDLRIIDQYRILVNQCYGDSSCQRICPEDFAPWDYDLAYSPPSGVDYFLPTDQSDLDADLCLLSYAHRHKTPKVLAGRFLLGETIGRGSYGKVKDAIDLVTLKRHAIKIVSKLGVRKIPGGWAQAFSEASVMRRLPANHHVVSMACALHLDNPERICFVMEHCLGSVHDLQAAGVPLIADDDDTEDFSRLRIGSECQIVSQPINGNSLQEVDDANDYVNDYNGGTGADRESVGDNNRSNPRRSGLFRGLFQPVSGAKVSGKLKFRKTSNIEAPFKKNKQVLQPNQQQQFRRLPEAQAHAYFLQLIDGLHFLHNNGVIHRDIKPANLLLTLHPGCGLSELNRPSDITMDAYNELEGNSCEADTSGFLGRSLMDLLTCSRGWLVKLTDFGVSASLSSFDSSDLVAGGQTTPAVQTPEVARGVQSLFVGSKLDVYSAGVTLYFMLIGRVPFSCNNVLQIFEAIAQGDYTIPGHISSNAASLIRKMMFKDPKKRFTLTQVSRHPWVTTAPPRPLLLSQIRQQLRAHLQPTQPVESSDTEKHRLKLISNQHRQRGIVCWLEPLVYLRRPSPDYALPHIDDSGARIYNEPELCEAINIMASMDAYFSPSRNADDEYDPLESGVAPLSVLDRLQTLLDRSDIVGQLPADSFILQDHLRRRHAPWMQKSPLTPQLESHELESRMANLDLQSNPVEPDMRYDSDGLDRFQDDANHQQILLPNINFQCKVAVGMSTAADSVIMEPPVCPEDLPICTPSPCVFQASNLIADDDFDFDISPVQHCSPLDVCERYSLTNKHISENSITARFAVGEHQQRGSVPTFSDTGFGLSDKMSNRERSRFSSRFEGRRLSHWFSTSISSIRRRLRNLRRRDTTRQTTDIIQQLPAKPTGSVSDHCFRQPLSDSIPLQRSSIQDATDERMDNMRLKRRRWRSTFRHQFCGLSVDTNEPSMQ